MCLNKAVKFYVYEFLKCEDPNSLAILTFIIITYHLKLNVIHDYSPTVNASL